MRLPLLGRLGHRVSWMLFAGCLVIAAVINLALVDPHANVQAAAVAAILVAAAGATYDIVIDAYRIETLKPYQLGTGAGMSQYGWRIGSAGAAALALVVAGRMGWHAAYMVCAVFALPAMITALLVGEPARHVVHRARSLARRASAIRRRSVRRIPAARGALLVLLFVLLHKIGDTLAQLTLRLLFNDLGSPTTRSPAMTSASASGPTSSASSSAACCTTQLGHEAFGAAGLVLMGVSNLSFAGLAAAGHRNSAMAAAIGFENIASGIRRRGGRGVLLGAVQPAASPHAVRADLGGRQRCRPRAHRDRRPAR